MTIKTNKNNLTLNEKIREDWGSIPFFCRKNNINYNTFKQTIYGYTISQKIVDILKKYNYKDINDLQNLINFSKRVKNER